MSVSAVEDSARLEQELAQARRDRERLEAMLEAALLVAAERSTDAVLHRLVHLARDLVSCRYVALGVPDGQGGFARFVFEGLSDEQVAAIGPLPRVHGMLAVMLYAGKPYRSHDVTRDERFEGYPRHHPWMRSFLSVPVTYQDAILGCFYLSEKTGEGGFTDEDQQTMERLAAHAGLALENARLFERSRELTILEERQRLARDLHDAVAQSLFSIVLNAEAALGAVERDPAAARDSLHALRRLAREAQGEMRSLIHELRPPRLEQEGLVGALRKHVEVLGRVRHLDADFGVEGEEQGIPFDVEAGLYRIAQEALNNVLKHANARAVRVRLRFTRRAARLRVEDDGRGFDPTDPRIRGRRLGLTSMQERAELLGGRLRVHSRAGAGTRVEVYLPLPRKRPTLLAAEAQT